ncbi:hypothetical protein PAXRUDRAFT_327928 [Paxillus rubicundulus Ve08.2h10]|uniref:Uncharacterized protein n=1 Tax=Paxillus rubicundulus Ve08.2h10 TaxID=930991 RepID=A0A0D0DCJ1_9AGAM|nr:hypothetical protein PAXRUDRAFT_327928 [Paxillus rubicundulus Ve08.2h10]
MRNLKTRKRCQNVQELSPFCQCGTPRSPALLWNRLGMKDLVTSLDHLSDISRLPNDDACNYVEAGDNIPLENTLPQVLGLPFITSLSGCAVAGWLTLCYDTRRLGHWYGVLSPQTIACDSVSTVRQSKRVWTLAQRRERHRKCVCVLGIVPLVSPNWLFTWWVFDEKCMDNLNIVSIAWLSDEALCIFRRCTDI